MVLKFTGYALRSRRLVKSRLDPCRVVIGIVVVGRISTHLGIEFGLHLSILDALEGSLLLLKEVVSVDVDDIGDLLLLVLDFGKCATVAPLEVVTLHIDRVFRARSHIVEAGTIHLLGLLISHLMSLHHIHFLFLDIVHVLHEVLSALQIFDSLVCALLFLEQLDNSRLNCALLVFYLPLMNHSLHHVSLSSCCTESADTCRHHFAAVDQRRATHGSSTCRHIKHISTFLHVICLLNIVLAGFILLGRS